MEHSQLRISDNWLSFSNDDLVIPTVCSVLLLLSSITPLLQVVLLELLKVYEPISSALGLELTQFVFASYGLISIAIFYQFYNAETQWSKIVANILGVLFFYPLITLIIRSFGYNATGVFFAAALIYGCFFIGIGLYRSANPQK
ncbi:hypothetical protein [Fodinibius sp.]|uniref:hypothetical protein n=1 Tax=Fodinibius sp. TaxID=1872440 RepID=UPI002ACDB369|nr:hypothetical protein [Fodinibius sp.]MDZ7659400.1 hypothetical protein [Fodinibius sp.]